MKNILIALFYVLDYLDQFKAIKENLLRGVGHLDPLRTPTYLKLSQKPQFVFFLEAFPYVLNTSEFTGFRVLASVLRNSYQK